MAEEREISTKMDLTKEETITEYVELREYLESENWAFPVVERIERRMSELAKMLMIQAIKDKENGRIIQNAEADRNADSRRRTA